MMERIARTIRLAAIGVLSSFVLFAGSAEAQEGDLTTLDLERLLQVEVDTVRGASRYLQKISEAPASITIVTAADIRTYGYRTLTDVLASVPGFYITDDRNYSAFATRGLLVPGDYNSRMLVLVDGHRINDNVFDSVLAGTEFPIDIDLIDRLEVIRGPGSAMYGANAFSAVINILTRGGARVNGLEVGVEAGTLGTGRGRVSFGKRYSNGADMLFSASGYRSEGDAGLYFPEFDTAGNNGGVAENSDLDRSRRFLGAFTFGDFAVRAAYGGRRKQIPTASFGTVFNDGREQTFDSRSYAEIQYGREVGRTVDVLARVYYDAVRYAGQYPVAKADAPPVVSSDTAAGDAVGSELTVSRTIGSRQRLMIGSEYRFNLRQDLATFDVEPFQQYLDSRHESVGWAVNVQDEVRVHRRVLASGGLRYDHQSLFAGRLTPRASLVVGPFRGTDVKVLYAAAFRAPSANDLYYNTPLSQYGNIDLRLESIRSVETVVEHSLSPSFGMNVSADRTTLDGIIAPGADPGGTYTNTGAAVDGLEVAARFLASPGLMGNVSYGYQHPRGTASSQRLHASPRTLAKLNAMTPLGTPHARGGFQVLYTGSIETWNGDRLPPSWNANVTITTWNLPHHIDVAASVYNLFDRPISDPVSSEHVQGAVPEYGRRLSVRLTWRLTRSR
jgi:outer membrane receptor for ferrienterochelin and colicins